jgi:hypothetical protein
VSDQPDKPRDDDFPVVEIVKDPGEPTGDHGPLTREEVDAIGASILFEAVFGKGTVRWALIIGFTVLTAALLATAFWAASISVTETLVVYMQPRLAPGRPNALRLALIDDVEGFIPLKQVSIVLERKHPFEEAILFSGPVEAAQAASLVIHPPRWSPGPYTMKLSAETLKKKKTAAVDVLLDPSFSGIPYTAGETAARLQGDPGELRFFDAEKNVRIEVFPESYILASSLHNLVYVRTTDGEGRPVRATVRLRLSEGFIHGDLPAIVETDDAGLASFMLYPTFNVITLQVSLADELAGPGPWGTLRLPVEPRVFRLRSNAPSVEAGGPMVVRIYTISKASPFFLDVHRGGLWSYATSGYLNTFSTEVTFETPVEPGLATVQGYGTPAMVGKAISSVHFWVRGKGESEKDSVRSVARLLAGMAIDRTYAGAVEKGNLDKESLNAGQLLAFLLSRLDTGFYEPTVFYTTRADDERATLALQDKLKRVVVTSLSCAAAIFALAVVLAVAMALKKKPAVIEEIEKAAPVGQAMEEIEDWKGRKIRVSTTPPLEELASRVSLHRTGWGMDSGMGSRKFFIQVALLAAVMAALFGLLIVLVIYMRWTFSL